MPAITVKGMQGLGDNIYQTPIIDDLCHRYEYVYLETPWPQLYEPKPNLKFLAPITHLRTQKKNTNKSKDLFSSPPFQVRSIRSLSLSYVRYQAAGIKLYKALMMCAGMSNSYYLEIGTKSENRQRTAVIRPATFRTEWKAAGRNPKQEYIQLALDFLKAMGYHTVVLADIHEPFEVYSEFRPTGADVYYEHGELDILEVMALVRHASIVVSGVGFMAPMCIALGTPCVMIHGGVGGYNHPKYIDAPGLGTLTHILPTHYCTCRNYAHSCDKNIEQTRIISTITDTIKNGTAIAQTA